MGWVIAAVSSNLTSPTIFPEPQRGEFLRDRMTQKPEYGRTPFYGTSYTSTSAMPVALLTPETWAV